MEQNGSHSFKEYVEEVLAFAWHPFLAHTELWRLGSLSVKLLPIVPVPLYCMRVRIRDAALAAAAVGLLNMPFLNRGRIPIGSLGTYAQKWRFNGPVIATLERVTTPRL